VQLRRFLNYLVLFVASQNCLFGQEKSSDLADSFGYQATKLLSRPTRAAPLQAQFEEKYFEKIQHADTPQLMIVGRAYRDAEGRVRKDFEHQVFSNPTVRVSVIFDPTTNIVYALDHDAKTVHKGEFPGKSAEKMFTSPAETPLDIYPAEHQLKRKDLGEREIEGFICHGYQLEIRVGNHTNRYEIWISSQLNEVLWKKK
jgi:hypothetical protein